jgi:hypothetical protein
MSKTKSVYSLYDVVRLLRPPTTFTAVLETSGFLSNVAAPSEVLKSD